MWVADSTGVTGQSWLLLFSMTCADFAFRPSPMFVAWMTVVAVLNWRSAQAAAWSRSVGGAWMGAERRSALHTVHVQVWLADMSVAVAAYNSEPGVL